MIRYPKIREFRILHDLKQEFVADQLGISQPEYSRLENGFRKARLEDFKTLAKVYDVSINVLMLREEEHLSQLLEQHQKILQYLQQSHLQSHQIIQQLIPPPSH